MRKRFKNSDIMKATFNYFSDYQDPIKAQDQLTERNKVLPFKKKTFDVIAFARQKLAEAGIDAAKYSIPIDESVFCYKCNITMYEWYNYCPKCGRKLK